MAGSAPLANVPNANRSAACPAAARNSFCNSTKTLKSTLASLPNVHTWCCLNGQPKSQRADIVVFFSPHDGIRLVKRVIGLPGDTIELRNNQLVLNGAPVAYQPITEELLRYIPAAERKSRVFASEKLPGQTHTVGGYPTAPAPRNFAPIVVPPGEYFMMGDNRDDSFDSRFYGPVKREKIVDRATAVVLSLDKSNYWMLRWKRSFASLQPDAEQR